MPSQTPAQLDHLLQRLEKASAPLNRQSLEEIAGEIGKLCGVAPDEVAVLALSRSGKALKFVLPERLQGVGEIPLSSTTALAARTARERRTDIVNSFATTRHASVFEGVPLGRRKNDEVIQKIMSAPIVREDKVIVIVQISRKGTSRATSGPDFTSSDLRSLQNLDPLLGRFLTLEREE